MIKKINAENFRLYGSIIGYPADRRRNAKKNLFCVVRKERKKVGWRICYLVVRDKVINKLEQHPDTFESFEPVKGRSLLFLARPGAPGRVECFLLDVPVVLNKGIWHGVVTQTKESEIKITENAEVKCIYRAFNPS